MSLCKFPYVFSDRITLKELNQLDLLDQCYVTKSDLTYAIHPLLNSSRWEIDESTWNEILPAVRLASAMLESEASFLFLASLINAKTRGDETLPNGHITSRIRKINPYIISNELFIPEPEEVDRVHSNLKDWFKEHLARRLVWKIKPSHTWNSSRQRHDVPKAHAVSSLPGHQMMPTTEDCRTDQYEDREMANDGTKHDVYTIYISEEYFLEPLRALHAALNPNEPAIQNAILRVGFVLAQAMGHEIAHVVASYTGRDCLETMSPFWEDQTLAEIGYAWENEVFGGSIDVADFYKPLSIVKWPHCCAYGKDGRGTAASRAPAKGSSTFYVVPMTWIGKMSSQRYWDENAINLDSKVHWCPKVLGIRVINHKHVSDCWRKSRSSEGRYPADPDGLVRRHLHEPWLRDWLKQEGQNLRRKADNLAAARAQEYEEWFYQKVVGVQSRTGDPIVREKALTRAKDHRIQAEERLKKAERKRWYKVRKMAHKIVARNKMDGE